MLACRELKDIQRIENLHQTNNLGDKKPSELLASMLEANKFILYQFLHLLLAKLRVFFDNDEEADSKNLAVKADWLLIYACPQAGRVFGGHRDSG